jgi:hypothetical protein
MNESRELQAAREHLARAERTFTTPGGLAELEVGLGMLDELMERNSAERAVANNLAAAYAAKIFERVNMAIAVDRTIPQPRLEHFFKLMLAFDEGDFTLPERARELKIAVVRRLIELAYEGHPPEVKRQALEKLGEITGDRRGEA